jgi:hypothetical protein
MRQAEYPKPKEGVAIDDQEADSLANRENHDGHAVELSEQRKR